MGSAVDATHSKHGTARSHCMFYVIDYALSFKLYLSYIVQNGSHELSPKLSGLKPKGAAFCMSCLPARKLRGLAGRPDRVP